MELGIIERDIHVEASPAVVFDVISRPEHMQEWWPDEARFEPVPGAAGEVAWRSDDGKAMTVALTLVEVDPPRRFSFRWCFEEPDRRGPSLLVTFDLTPSGTGTHVRMTESGFREMGWEVARLEEQYREHATAWDHFVPALGAYAERQVASR